MGSSEYASEEYYIPFCSFIITTKSFFMKRANFITFYGINNPFILANELFRCKNGAINSRFPTISMGLQCYLSSKNKSVQIYIL